MGQQPSVLPIVAPSAKRRRLNDDVDVSGDVSDVSCERKNRVLHHLLTHTSSDLLPAFVTRSAADHCIQDEFSGDAFDQLRLHHCVPSCRVLPADLEISVKPTNTFHWGLSLSRKTDVLQFLLKNFTPTASSQLSRLAGEHHVAFEGSSAAFGALRVHCCDNRCLVRIEDVERFSRSGSSPSSVSSPCFISYQKHPLSASPPAGNYSTQPSPLPATHSTRAHHSPPDKVSVKDPCDTHCDLPNEHSWPELLPWDEHKAMLRESRARTNAASLRREPCSFCNKNELLTKMHTWPKAELDVSVLDSAIRRLRDFYDVPEMQSYRTFDDCYRVCPTCSCCVKKQRFVRVPLLSWANGCWVGDVPKELADLTYAEELVIARAHTTKCWLKLNAGPRSSVLQQRATSGNVCVHPHEITNIASHLPRPINSLYDEIVVMFVTDNREASEDTFKSTPLLVRRGKILAALSWLKIHNRLYRDIEINYPVLPDYPDETRGETVPDYPIQFITPNSTQAGLSSTYSGHGIDGTEAMFSVDASAVTGGIPISASGSFDVDSVQSGLNLRKIQALRSLKDDGDSFLKTSSSSNTLNTRNNPDVYGMLWPTLFPYGVGLFEDPMRLSSGFRSIKLRSHVRHYLQLSDRRFQLHLSFIFAMQSIQMIRKLSFESHLAVRRAWWPKAVSAMEKIDVKVLDDLIRKMVDRQARMDHSTYKAVDDSEQVILDLLKYIDYCSEQIEGSTAHVMAMREEIRAVSRACGTPSIFFTLNPADNHNPLSSFMAGKNIDIDALFNAPDSRYTSFDRARSLAANPVAGAQFFQLMVSEFIDVFLGVGRPNRRGVFGQVRHYYGVVEAQNRGSLHLHILIWLTGALSPIRIQHKVSEDRDFQSRLFSWLDSIFSHDYPPDTEPSNFKGWMRIACICGRPPHPDSPDFDDLWPKYVRLVLEASGQEHDHGDTCFKKLTRSFASLTADEKDKLCRFFYPLDLVPETYMDADGRIFFKRHNANMVGHNTTISGAFQCNTDGKFVGSGPFALALGVYMTNYTTKSTLDSAVVMTALAAATASLQRSERDNNSSDNDAHSRSRRLLLKTLNQMNGRRELSGQQVASALLGIPNHFTDCRFHIVYWSALLSWLEPCLFPPFSARVDDGQPPNSDDDGERDGFDTSAAATDDLVDLTNSRIVLHGHSNKDPPPSSLVYDVLYRPQLLERICMWDQLCLYEKVALAPGVRTSRGEIGEDGEEAEQVPSAEPLYFLQGHPQHDTHVLKKRCHAIVPVLTGFSIPRRDIQEQRDKYCVTMLALFRPWSRDVDAPLKTAENTWDVAWESVLSSLTATKSIIVDHIQEQWECRKAAADFAALNKTRYASFRASVRSRAEPDLDADLVDDIDWQLGQGNVAVAGIVDDLDGERSGTESDVRPSSLPSVMVFARKAEAEHLYAPQVIAYTPVGCAKMVSFQRREEARALAESLSKEKEAKNILRLLMTSTINDRTASHGARSSNVARSCPQNDPIVTTLVEELRKAKLRAMFLHAQDPAYWETLHLWEQEAIAVANTMTLNKKQRIAFLLIVDDRLSLLRHTKSSPFRIILGGSGGSGKSHLYEAVRLWYRRIDELGELLFTAPTGIAAANVNGSTVHSELSLRLRYDHLTKPNSVCLEKLRARLEPIRTLIIDEFYFLGCNDFLKISRNLNLARTCTDDMFGGLDLILSGDQFQLPGPLATPLYRHSITTSLNSSHSRLHGLNESNRQAVEAVKNLWNVRQCIVFDEIVRQRNPRFVALLERLRHGCCTIEGPNSDLQLLRSFRLNNSDPSSLAHTDILRWVQDAETAPPLITYTNAIREEHNWRMTECLAATTGQEFAVYYSYDTTGKGRKQTTLTGQNAVDAWNTPQKYNAHDLAGRLPLTIGMPVLIVENIAVQLGLCNGSFGTLVNVEYIMENGRRYASSVELNVPRYNSPDETAEHPHRVAIPLTRGTLQYRSSTNGKQYSGHREQLPIIPGFAFTAHNSQSRSLDSVTVHLESSASIATSYVMLSRIKCTENGPIALKIMGDIPLAKIASHAAEEVRLEEQRLQTLQQNTLRDAAAKLQWYTDATGESLIQ